MPGALTGFDTYYGQEPWSGIDKKTIPYYVPELADQFRRFNVYAPFTTFAVSMLQNAAETMHFTEIYDLEYDKATIDNRALWLTTQYFDSRQLSITTSSYGSKVALHKHDPRVAYWRMNGGDIRQIARGALGLSMTQQIDELARDAFLSGPFWLISGHSSGTMTASNFPDFSVITSSDTFDPDIASQIWLIMDDKNVPGANDPTGLGGNVIFAITSHNVWYDLVKPQASSTNLFKTALTTLQSPMIMNYEMGQYMNTRYIKTPLNVLWNCGTITAQTTLTADVPVGAGAATTVHNHYTVGQTALRTSDTNSEAGTRYITVADATGFSVGDMITLHKTRTSVFGVTNGVDYREGTLTNRHIVSISGSNIALDKPVLKCEYAQGHYVTKALHVNATIFVGGPRAVVWAVTQSPAMYTPPIVDDRMAQLRVTWDMTAKAQSFKPEYAYVVYSAASSAEGILPQ
jgi:hypothetical protein